MKMSNTNFRYLCLRKQVLSLISTAVCCLVIAGCTTTSSTEKPTKWEPLKRANAHVDLAMDYLQRGKFDVAGEELDLAISINPNSDRAHHAKGLLFAQRGFESEAKSSFAKAVKLNKSNFLAINDYGIYQCQTGAHDGGIELLTTVEQRQDNVARNNTLLGLGICHYGKRNYSEAKRYLRTVLTALPRLHQALLPMADISYAEGNFLNARAFVERYIALGALSEKILVIGANTEIKLGDIAKAKQYAAELRRAYPTSKEISAYRKLLSNG